MIKDSEKRMPNASSVSRTSFTGTEVSHDTQMSTYAPGAGGFVQPLSDPLTMDPTSTETMTDIGNQFVHGMFEEVILSCDTCLEAFTSVLDGFAGTKKGSFKSLKAFYHACKGNAQKALGDVMGARESFITALSYKKSSHLQRAVESIDRFVKISRLFDHKHKDILARYAECPKLVPDDKNYQIDFCRLFPLLATEQALSTPQLPTVGNWNHSEHGNTSTTRDSSSIFAVDSPDDVMSFCRRNSHRQPGMDKDTSRSTITSAQYEYLKYLINCILYRQTQPAASSMVTLMNMAKSILELEEAHLQLNLSDHESFIVVGDIHGSRNDCISLIEALVLPNIVEHDVAHQSTDEDAHTLEALQEHPFDVDEVIGSDRFLEVGSISQSDNITLTSVPQDSPLLPDELQSLCNADGSATTSTLAGFCNKGIWSDNTLATRLTPSKDVPCNPAANLATSQLESSTIQLDSDPPRRPSTKAYSLRKRIVFLGDYVDRGPASNNVLVIVLILKLLFPSMISLLRGNHESEAMNQMYGYKLDMYFLYGSDSGIYEEVLAMFAELPLSLTVSYRLYSNGLNNLSTALPLQEKCHVKRRRSFTVRHKSEHPAGLERRTSTLVTGDAREPEVLNRGSNHVDPRTDPLRTEVNIYCCHAGPPIVSDLSLKEVFGLLGDKRKHKSFHGDALRSNVSRRESKCLALISSQNHSFAEPKDLRIGSFTLDHTASRASVTIATQLPSSAAHTQASPMFSPGSLGAPLQSRNPPRTGGDSTRLSHKFNASKTPRDISLFNITGQTPPLVGPDVLIPETISEESTASIETLSLPTAARFLSDPSVRDALLSRKEAPSQSEESMSVPASDPRFDHFRNAIESQPISRSFLRLMIQDVNTLPYISSARPASLQAQPSLLSPRIDVLSDESSDMIHLDAAILTVEDITINDYRHVMRKSVAALNSFVSESLWSDPGTGVPTPKHGYIESFRRLGFIYSQNSYREWARRNHISLCMRGHEVPNPLGLREDFTGRQPTETHLMYSTRALEEDPRHLTVFSASVYDVFHNAGCAAEVSYDEGHLIINATNLSKVTKEREENESFNGDDTINDSESV